MSLRGPVGHCEVSVLHNGKPRFERPQAMYLIYPMPCEQRSCVGRLICVGHAVCAECAAAIRADRTRWAKTGHDVEVAMLHGATR